MCSCVFLYEYDFAKRLSSYKYGNYSTNYDYDKDNLVDKKIEKLFNTSYTYNYEYNKELALTKLTNSNNVFNYNYDILGRLDNQNINNEYVTKYKYITSGNKTSTVIESVDDNGIIYTYTYDKLGNITEIRKNNTLTNKYYYDEYSELIKEDDLINNVTKQYVYDNYGNVLSKKTYTYNTTNLIKEDKYEYNNSNWQDLLTKFNNETITYDMIGNPLSIGNKTLTWMNGRELSTYSDGTNNISYKYNLNGIRTSKVVNGIKTNYIFEGTSIIFEDRNGTMLYYIYNGDELLGFVYNSKTYYYHKNIFGDIIGILDSNYNEIVSYEYDSWGALVNTTDNSNIDLGTINPFRYRSYYYDEETKLYYLNSRYYNPEIGRFINADSIVLGNQDIISGNLFQYVSNNPVSYSDFFGRSIFSSILNKAKNVLNNITKTLENIRSNVQHVNNSTQSSVKSNASLFTMFGKSFGANNNRSLSSNEIRTLENELKKSQNLNDIITSTIAQTPRNQTTFSILGSVADTSKESFLSKGIVGKYNYRMEGILLQDNMWNIHIYVSDTYDFTEYRSNWWRNPLSFANNVAKFGTDIGVIGAYDWEVDFYINRKDIWR